MVQVTKNIMSVDLEEYFAGLHPSLWDGKESKIIETTRPLLDLLDKYDVKATFFTLGYSAERNPDLIREISSKGHEIASHSYYHFNLKKITKEAFEEDLSKSLEVIHRITGQKVLGFRAPFLSINSSNLWVFEVLKKYVRYDSSLMPVKFHYGNPPMPHHIYRFTDNPYVKEKDGEFIEIPLTTVPLPLLGNIPSAGGFYLRFLPFSLIEKGIQKSNEFGYPAVFYIHPRDLDPDTPRIEGYKWYHYWGLKDAAKKFERLLKQHKFTTAKEILGL